MTKQQETIIRFILYTVLLGASLVLWEKWQQSSTSHEKHQQNTQHIISQDINAGPKTKSVYNPTNTIKVTTDTLTLTIDKTGGKLINAKLNNYPTKLNGDIPVQLLSKSSEHSRQIISGFINENNLVFSSAANQYSLGDDNQISVVLTANSNDGLKFQKTFTLHRGKYLIDLTESVTNNSSKTIQQKFFADIQQQDFKESTSFGQLRTFTGFSYYTPESHYNKLSIDDVNESSRKIKSTGGWIASQQHYFITAIVPPAKYKYKIYAAPLDDDGEQFVLRMISNSLDIAPRETVNFDNKLYIGPENAKILEAISPGLGLTIDYGWLWFISNGLFFLLEQIHNYVPNWGIAIILLTLLIKLAFYKLSEKSFASMAKMKKFQPELVALKSKHGNNKEALAKATMELYKKEKINPLGGCLPMLLQIPFFIALYWVLMESIELRHAPFFGWIQDLSSKDPYFILPVLMGLSMLWQQRLMPAQDPDQAKAMMVMPLIFTIMFLSFPSGLVLYWLTNNLLSILQQWYCTKKYN